MNRPRFLLVGASLALVSLQQLAALNGTSRLFEWSSYKIKYGKLYENSEVESAICFDRKLEMIQCK